MHPHQSEIALIIKKINEDITNYLNEYIELLQKDIEINPQNITKVKDSIYGNLNKFLFNHQKTT